MRVSIAMLLVLAGCGACSDPPPPRLVPPLGPAATPGATPAPPRVEDLAMPAPPSPVPNAAQIAREEFEVLDDTSAGGYKLYSRGDFLPKDDPRAMSDGDFFGRLRALFGPSRRGNEYVLRHRASGAVISAYSAQSGPSYGGGATLGDDDVDMVAEDQAREQRIAADPILARGRPVDWSVHDPQQLPREEVDRLRAIEHAWNRRMADALAPPTAGTAVRRLDALISSVDPVDWESLRYWADDPSVYRVGARDGQPFEETLRGAAAFRALVAAATHTGPAIDDVDGDADPDARVVELWAYEADHGRPLEAERAEARAAWQRWATRLRGTDDARAIELAEKLGIDPTRARAALANPS